MPKPSVHYTLTFIKHLGSGSHSFICVRGGKQISECFQHFSSISACRQSAYVFLSFAVEHYQDRNRFIVSEREVREGKKKERKARLFPFHNAYDDARSNIINPNWLKRNAPKPKVEKPSIIPTRLEDL